LSATQKERDKANAALATATQALTDAEKAAGEVRGEIDTLVGASYRNGQIVQLSALFTSDSTENFLDQMSALDVLASDNGETLARLTDITDQATAARTTTAQAQKRAQDAATAAETAVNTFRQRQSDLDRQIGEVRAALGELDPEARERLGTVQDNGVYLGPPGAANDAMQAALSKRGSEYEWGATGPNEFDCSGPHVVGLQASGHHHPPHQPPAVHGWTRGAPGRSRASDLLFYDDGTNNPATVHHVAMYVGDGRMVDAPTEGQVVDVRPMEGDGHLMGARRIAE
jgi:cell wall-associated NlpC family hydrolase